MYSHFEISFQTCQFYLIFKARPNNSTDLQNLCCVLTFGHPAFKIQDSGLFCLFFFFHYRVIKNKHKSCMTCILEVITVMSIIIQWSLDITNLYVTKSSVKRTIFFIPAVVNYMEKNLDMTNIFCQYAGSSLYRGSTLIMRKYMHDPCEAFSLEHYQLS